MAPRKTNEETNQVLKAAGKIFPVPSLPAALNLSSLTEPTGRGQPFTIVLLAFLEKAQKQNIYKETTDYLRTAMETRKLETLQRVSKENNY